MRPPKSKRNKRTKTCLVKVSERCRRALKNNKMRTNKHYEFSQLPNKICCDYLILTPSSSLHLELLQLDTPHHSHNIDFLSNLEVGPRLQRPKTKQKFEILFGESLRKVPKNAENQEYEQTNVFDFRIELFVTAKKALVPHFHYHLYTRR